MDKNYKFCQPVKTLFRGKFIKTCMAVKKRGVKSCYFFSELSKIFFTVIHIIKKQDLPGDVKNLSDRHPPDYITLFYASLSL